MPKSRSLHVFKTIPKTLFCITTTQVKLYMQVYSEFIHSSMSVSSPINAFLHFENVNQHIQIMQNQKQSMKISIPAWHKHVPPMTTHMTNVKMITLPSGLKNAHNLAAQASVGQLSNMASVYFQSIACFRFPAASTDTKAVKQHSNNLLFQESCSLAKTKQNKNLFQLQRLNSFSACIAFPTSNPAQLRLPINILKSN